MGKLLYFLSPMGGSKTATLLIMSYNNQDNGLKVAVMKPLRDTRDTRKIVSRVPGLSRDADHLIVSTDNLFELIRDNFSDIHRVYIDEIQWLTEDQINQLDRATVEYPNLSVFAFGLRTDRFGDTWPGSARLLAVADELIQLDATCFVPGCGENATMTIAYEDGKRCVSGPQDVVDDGSTSLEYFAACRYHFHNAPLTPPIKAP